MFVLIVCWFAVDKLLAFRLSADVPVEDAANRLADAAAALMQCLQVTVAPS